MRKPVATIAIGLIAIFLDARLLPAQVQIVDVGRAQVEMLQRIDEVTKTYAKTIGITQNWIGYCQQELHLKTYTHPLDGSIPFGINYNAIPDRKTLDQVISTRENYEISFITLCLANAKKTLAR